MIVANRICGLILLILALVSLWEGMKTWDGMGGTGFMPVIVGIIFALLGLGRVEEALKLPGFAARLRELA